MSAQGRAKVLISPSGAARSARRGHTSAFRYVDGELCAERVPLARIAERFGTPCYVYSRAALEANYRAFDGALARLPHRIFYAMKANPNLAVLERLRAAG